MKKNTYLTISFLLSWMMVQSQSDPMLTQPYSPTQIEAAIGSGTLENLYFTDLVSFGVPDDESTLSETTPSNYKIDELYYVLSLRTNPMALPADLVGKNFEAIFEYQLISYSDATGLETSPTMQLTIDYDEVGTTNYTAKAFKLLRDRPYVRVEFISFTIIDRNTGNPVTDLVPYDNLIELRQNLTLKNTYQPIPSEAPTVPFLTNTDKNWLRFTWKNLSWAELYEVEYLYVDDISATGGILQPEDIPFDFTRNSTRVEVPSSGGLGEYLIPHVFEYGYILARVRAVGFWGTNPVQRTEGAWSAPDKGTGIPGAPGSLAAYVFDNAFGFDLIRHEDGAMNWQHVTTFVEDGKRADVLTYRDGTLRERQVNAINSTEEQVITSEHMYDHVGRTAIQFLPTPHDPTRAPRSGNPVDKPWFEYNEDFNLNGSGTTFKIPDFEYSSTSCTDPFPAPATTASNTIGAGQYYSPNNPDQTNQQAFVPDSKGYPFTQVEYTNDQTNRVRRSGQLGEDFQLGSGQETKYFYTSPSQDELDRVFGTDVGFAQFYRKVVTIDPNGQASIRYEDLDGNTIATALAGESPNNMAALSNQLAQNITLNLFEGGQIVDVTNRSLTSSKTVYISGEPGTTVPVALNFQLSANSFVPSDCPSACYSCVYDLRLKVQSDCGSIVYEYINPVGSLSNLLTCTPHNVLLNESLNLAPGEYTFTKSLVMREDAIFSVVGDYLSNCVSLSVPIDLPGTCDPDPCNVCPPVESLYINYGDITYDYASQYGGATVSLPTFFPPITDPSCSDFCEDNLPNLLESTFKTLLGDVSPGGQYAEYIDSSRAGSDPRGVVDPGIFPLSVLNESDGFSVPGIRNDLPFQNAHWRNPAGGIYRNRDGSASLVPVPTTSGGALDESFFNDTATIVIIDEAAHVYPQAINQVKDFIAAWQPSWAYALVVYHPEYPYYVFTQDYFSSFENEQTIQETDEYSVAQGLFPDLTDADPTNDFAGDVFVDGFSGARALYNDLAEKYIRKEESDPNLVEDYSIVQSAEIVVHCGNTLFTASELETCENGVTLYSSGNPSLQDVEWQTYRAMAIDVKNQVFQQLRQDFIESNNFFSNHVIGTPEVDLFEDRQKRYLTQGDASLIFTDEEGNDFTDDIEQFQQYHEKNRKEDCGICPSTDGLVALMNALFQQDRFGTTVSFPEPPSLSFPVSLIDELGVTTSDPIQWEPFNTNDFDQFVNILANGSPTPLATLYFESDLIPFADIEFITCVQLGDPQLGGVFNFFATGFDINLDTTLIRGVIPFNIYSCPQTAANPCRDDDFADDMKVFLNYIFQNDIYDETSFDLYNPSSFNPALTTAMEDRLDAEGVNDWTWNLIGNNPSWTSITVDWVFIDGGSTVAYYFDLTISDPDFDLRDIEEVIAIRKRQGDAPTGTKFAFEFIARDINGFEFPVSVADVLINPYFPILNCNTVPDDPAGDEGYCCSKPIRYEPGPDCATDFNEIAEGNRFLIELSLFDSLQQKFTTEYINHCLGAAEQFTADYEEKLYQFTLYYYDQANNLVQTIPPKGVDYLTDSEVNTTQADRLSNPLPAALNSHTLSTSYQHNSFNKTVRKDSPDEGRIEFTFDEIGRMITSRDAVQAGNNIASYLLYDDLGRLFESGTVGLVAIDLPTRLEYSAFESTVAAGTRKEIFTNVYDQGLAGSELYFDQDRNLRNRLGGMTYQDFEGGLYDHATHYGYDALGNAHTVVQDFALLSREFPIGPACSPEDLIFQDQVMDDGVYQTTGDILTIGDVEVVNGSDVTYRAGVSITLNPGFESGYEFLAIVEGCAASSGTPTIPQHIKKVEYDYDLLSGKINEQRYQAGEEDEFIHRYEYDASNRLVEVKTTHFSYEPEDLWDTDAQYTYYHHGPLARVEIGSEQVQGMDMAYTINGWLKGMNSGTLFPERDIGGDGLMGGMRSQFARDAYGFVLGYYEDDYESIKFFDLVDRFHSNVNPPLPTADFNGLYNGNIWYLQNANSGLASNPIQLHAYQYDQLNRLVKSNVLQNPLLSGNKWSGSTFGNAFASSYAYDPNGNLTSLIRRDENGSLLDNLSYNYEAASNRLRHVDDSETTAYEDDLEDQALDNYAYDGNGRLIEDAAEGMASLEWMSNNRLKTYMKNGERFELKYNAKGHRVLKRGLNSTTYYVRDDEGIILSTYELANDQTTWKYVPIHGANRLGTYSPERLLDGSIPDTSIQVRGQRQYELTSHAGNVQVLVNDRKIPQSGFFTAQILNATDYYPFGMLIPSRQISNESYAFGFQGMLMDNDFKGLGNSYSTEFRQYDSRVARWLSVDPLADQFPSSSPYVAFGNNPISFTDFDGAMPRRFVINVLNAEEVPISGLLTVIVRDSDGEESTRQTVDISAGFASIELDLEDDGFIQFVVAEISEADRNRLAQLQTILDNNGMRPVPENIVREFDAIQTRIRQITSRTKTVEELRLRRRGRAQLTLSEAPISGSERRGSRDQNSTATTRGRIDSRSGGGSAGFEGGGFSLGLEGSAGSERTRGRTRGSETEDSSETTRQRRFGSGRLEVEVENPRPRRRQRRRGPVRIE